MAPFNNLNDLNRQLSIYLAELEEDRSGPGRLAERAERRRETEIGHTESSYKVTPSGNLITVFFSPKTPSNTENCYALSHTLAKGHCASFVSPVIVSDWGIKTRTLAKVKSSLQQNDSKK